MSRIAVFSLFLIALVVAACNKAAPQPAPVSVKSGPQLPVTQVVQTFNRPYDQAWSLLTNALKQANLVLITEAAEQGEALTGWVEVEDSLCGILPKSGAMLSCRVRFLLKLNRVSDRASTFALSYYEECYDRKSLNLECPDSNAERMLIKLAESLKASVGAP